MGERTPGVYYRAYENRGPLVKRWVGYMKRHGKSYQRHFHTREEAIAYRRELERLHGDE